jgi:hypothetical protein
MTLTPVVIRILGENLYQSAPWMPPLENGLVGEGLMNHPILTAATNVDYYAHTQEGEAI